MKVKSESESEVVSDSYNPMDCSLPGFSVHGIFQAKVLEWGATAFSIQPSRGGKESDTTERLSTIRHRKRYDDLG